MKTFLIALFLLTCSALPAFAQTESISADTSKVYELYNVQEPPSFPGGESEMYKFMMANTKYPETAKKEMASGVVALLFIIRENGSITDINVIRKVAGGCTEEAIRMVSTMPKWIPGKVNGVPVACRYMLPVRFVPN